MVNRGGRITSSFWAEHDHEIINNVDIDAKTFGEVNALLKKDPADSAAEALRQIVGMLGGVGRAKHQIDIALEMAGRDW